MGKKILDEQETNIESESLKERLQTVDLEWQQILNKLNIVKYIFIKLIFF